MYDSLQSENKFMADHIKKLAADKMKEEKKVSDLEKKVKELESKHNNGSNGGIGGRKW